MCLGLYFRLHISILPRTIIQNLLSEFVQPETLPRHPQTLLDSSRLGSTQVHLVPLVSGPLSTHITPSTTCLDLYWLITTQQPPATPSAHKALVLQWHHCLIHAKTSCTALSFVPVAAVPPVTMSANAKGKAQPAASPTKA